MFSHPLFQSLTGEQHSPPLGSDDFSWHAQEELLADTQQVVTIQLNQLYTITGQEFSQAFAALREQWHLDQSSITIKRDECEHWTVIVKASVHHTTQEAWSLDEMVMLQRELAMVIQSEVLKAYQQACTSSDDLMSERMKKVTHHLLMVNHGLMAINRSVKNIDAATKSIVKIDRRLHGISLLGTICQDQAISVISERDQNNTLC